MQESERGEDKREAEMERGVIEVRKGEVDGLRGGESV